MAETARIPDRTGDSLATSFWVNTRRSFAATVRREGFGIIALLFLILFIIGFTMGGLNYVVTVLQARTRGMTLMRMPLTVWGIFTATVMALLTRASDEP